MFNLRSEWEASINCAFAPSLFAVREVACASTMAQQRRRTHDPAIRMVVVYMPRSQQAVWSILGQTTRYLAHLASKTGQGTEDGLEQDEPPRGLRVCQPRGTYSGT